MAFPLIIMALAIVSIFGTGVHNVIVAITIPLIPRCARVVRSSALAIREVPYVDAARACGFGHTRIILRHMVPNVMAPFLIMLTAFVGQAILAEASLSYLGLGVQEPVPAWGLMLQGGAEEYASTAPWIAIFPGLAIMLTVFGINLFGDALRDALDPKLRTGERWDRFSLSGRLEPAYLSCFHGRVAEHCERVRMVPGHHHTGNRLRGSTAPLADLYAEADHVNCDPVTAVQQSRRAARAAAGCAHGWH